MPIDPEELSGLLDGELDPERTLQVEAALAADPNLYAEFTRLRETDHAWRLAAAAVRRPISIRVQNRVEPILRRDRVTASGFILTGLLTLRIASKTENFALSDLAILQGLALAVVLLWAAHLVRDLARHP